MKTLMLTAIAAMIATMLVVEFALPQGAQVSCSNYPPELSTHTELDPDPARYAGPAVLEGEEPTMRQWPAEKDYVLTDKGAEITYHDAGQLYTHECPEGSAKPYWFEEDQWVKHLPTEGCWKWEPVKISSCDA